MTRIKNTAMLAAIAAMAIGLFAGAETVQAADDNPNPYLKADESWISISGTAVDVDDESFTLDYGEGTVTVEMDDWGWDNEDETGAMLEGDKVTVYGEVDDDLYETTTIEASSVYVEPLGTYYYASSADEEYDDDYDYWIVGDEIDVGEMTVRGTVTSESGREFTIDTGARELTIDTIEMSYNPLDDSGYLGIDKGDYVSVSGEMDIDTWEERELMADSVVTLDED